MSNDKKPTPDVIGIGHIAMVGNVHPFSWYKKLTLKDGKKANLPAIAALAEICYWYKPRIIRDEHTGEILRYEKKFSGDKLQRTYGSFEIVGLSYDQAYNACKYLEEKGLITLENRTVDVGNGKKLGNVLYIGVNVREIARLTNGVEEIVENPPTLSYEDDSLSRTNESPLSCIDETLSRTNDTCTEVTTENIREDKSSFSLVAKNAGNVPEETGKKKKDAVKKRERVLTDEQLAVHQSLMELAKVINDGVMMREGENARMAKKLRDAIEKGTWTAEEVVGCARWLFHTKQFKGQAGVEGYNRTLTSVYNNMAAYRAGKENGTLDVRRYENREQRNERIREERNIEEITDLALDFKDQLKAALGR